jgi:hypothetical protein
MAGFNLSQIHVSEREPGTQNYRVTKVYPAMRLSSAGQVVYLQHGRYWTPGGDPIRSKDLPDWVTSELKKCSPAALAEVGIHIKVEEQPVDLTKAN